MMMMMMMTMILWLGVLYLFQQYLSPIKCNDLILIELEFNGTTTLQGHFEKGRRMIEEIVEVMKKRDRGERKMNDSEETEEIKTFPSTLTCCKDSRPCPVVSQYQLDTPVT